MRSIRQLFSREGLNQKLLDLDSRSPSATIVMASCVTGIGYVAFALLPLLALIGVFKLIGGISNATTISAWLHLSIWATITAASAAVLVAQLIVKFSIPSGLGLKEDKAPRLYELLAELGETYKLPRIHRLVMHDKFSLEFVPVPRFGLPLLTTNVLYIGLPILQSLSPAEFRGALAGLLGQYSGKQNRKTHWIYRWNQFCLQNQQAYRKRKSAIIQPMRLFFKWYTPMLQYFTASALRQDELEADFYMMEIMNDTEAADVILRFEVSQAFLRNKYWPKINAMLRKNPANPDHLPHINMAKVLRNGLTENEFAQTLKDLINQENTWQNTKPGLHSRLENIGQRKLNMPPPVMETAAQRYLGDAYGAVIKLLDKQWLARHGGKSAKHKKSAQTKSETITAEPKPAIPPAQKHQAASPATTPGAQQQTQGTMDTLVDDRLPNISSEEGATVTVADRKRLAELKQKADFADLTDNEAWELAHLTEKLGDKSLAISLYQQVLKQNPNHAKTLFAVGRILISQNDASGVKVLERAMGMDKGCIAQGCWMLAKYFKATGDDARSKQYLERAASVSVAA